MAAVTARDGELSAQYDAAATEREVAARWEAAHAFDADADQTTRLGGERPAFVICMPPPNVTAMLHVGHGLDITVQDVLIRWRRMAGRRSPVAARHRSRRHRDAERGRESAGCARARRDALSGGRRSSRGSRASSSRPAATILQQLRGIGASADWSRTAYTLSPAAFPRGARSVRPPLRGRPDLSRPSRHPLVPPMPHVAQRRRGRAPEETGRALSHPVPCGWRPAARASSWPPRGRKRCSATSPLRCIRTMRGTAISSVVGWCCPSSASRSRSSPTQPSILHLARGRSR